MIDIEHDLKRIWNQERGEFERRFCEIIATGGGNFFSKKGAKQLALVFEGVNMKLQNEINKQKCVLLLKNHLILMDVRPMS